MIGHDDLVKNQNAGRVVNVEEVAEVEELVLIVVVVEVDATVV